MQIEIKKKVIKEIEETVALQLVPYWVVRVIRTDVYNNKECIAENEFAYIPGEQEIGDTLAEHIGENVFASVVKNYRFKEEGGNND